MHGEDVGGKEERREKGERKRKRKMRREKTIIRGYYIIAESTSKTLNSLHSRNSPSTEIH